MTSSILQIDARVELCKWLYPISGSIYWLGRKIHYLFNLTVEAILRIWHHSTAFLSKCLSTAGAALNTGVGLAIGSLGLGGALLALSLCPEAKQVPRLQLAMQILAIICLIGALIGVAFAISIGPVAPIILLP